MLGAMCGICGLFGGIDPRAGAETVFGIRELLGLEVWLRSIQPGRTVRS